MATLSFHVYCRAYSWLTEPTPRATFRSGALSQPSQMGNFKHQSTRTSDRDRDRERDRDRDGDKERERDIRDREGQERLRSVSLTFSCPRVWLTCNLPTCSFQTSTIVIGLGPLRQTVCAARTEKLRRISASARAD